MCMSRSHCGPPAKHCKCCNGSHDVLGRVATVTAVSPSPKSANVMNLCFRGKAEEGKQALTGRLADGTDHRQGPNIFPNGLSPCLDNHRPNAQITMATGKLKATDVTGIYLSVVSRGGRGPLECLVRQILIRFNRDISPWKWEWGGNKMPLFYWKCKCMSVGRYSQTCNTRFRINGITQCQ